MLREDLTKLLEKGEADKIYDMPIPIMVEYIFDCLATFDRVIKRRNDFYMPKPPSINKALEDMQKAITKTMLDRDFGDAKIAASLLLGKARINYIHDRLVKSVGDCLTQEVNDHNMKALAMVIMNNLSLLEQPDKTQIKVDVCEDEGKMLATPGNEYTKFLFNVVYG